MHVFKTFAILSVKGREWNTSKDDELVIDVDGRVRKVNSLVGRSFVMHEIFTIRE